MCNGTSDASDLNGDAVTVGDAGGRCCTCTIGFDTQLTNSLVCKCIKILQSRLAKSVTHRIHTKFSPVPVVPVSSKLVSYE